MSEPTWSRFKQVFSMILALIPLVGSVIVVYSGLEVVKSQVQGQADDIAQLRVDFQGFRAEYQDDVRDLRAEIRDVRNGHKP